MEIIIAKIARQEFEDAKQYYELQQAGHGIRFKNEIKLSLIRIQQFPDAWPLERDEIHKYLIHKFPYKILYSIQKKYDFSAGICSSTQRTLILDRTVVFRIHLLSRTNH